MWGGTSKPGDVELAGQMSRGYSNSSDLEHSHNGVSAAHQAMLAYNERDEKYSLPGRVRLSSCTLPDP